MAFDDQELIEGVEQYGRVCKLFVSDANQNSINLSEFRIKFSVKRTMIQTPNTAEIRIYNLSPQTGLNIKNNFISVMIEAGYEGNSGVIFSGNIKQVILGRENSTDTFVDILAGDGQIAYNYSIVNASLAAGSSLFQQLDTLMKPMSKNGVSLGYYKFKNDFALQRGVTLWGSPNNYLQDIANTDNQDWSIQNERVVFVSTTTYLPGEVVVLTSKTGLIGLPQQTVQGVNCRSLLNPFIQIGGRIQIDNASVQAQQINLNITDPKQIEQSIPAGLNQDGVYFVFGLEHQGDTRGGPWYTNLITLTVEPTVNQAESVALL